MTIFFTYKWVCTKILVKDGQLLQNLWCILLKRIFNVAGQLISQQQISTPGRDEEIQINISKLSAGVYLLRIDAGDLKTTRHIIKK